MMVRGQVPLSVSVTANELSIIPQLSPADPPALLKSAKVAYAGGTSVIHSKLTSAGQSKNGSTKSSTVMTCMHSPGFPHESSIEYVRLIVLGQVPLSVSTTEKELNIRLQLSPADPPPLVKSIYVVNGGGISPLHS